MEERCGIWRLERILAVGGIAEVWRASASPKDGAGAVGAPRQVAVKILHSHLVRHDEVRAMFETECGLLGELPHHPGLVHGLGRGLLGARPWVAMNLVEGRDLRRYLDGGSPDGAARPRSVSPATALLLVARACDAVVHLHDQGWVHGDVVPANLMVSEDLEALVLCDFGVARRSGQGGPVQGTHAYMAPEQVRGQAWTPATDVFALGVMLWELLEGKRLFHRGPSWLTMRAVLEEPVPPLADRTLDAIVRQALAPVASDRLRDARALARKLEACGAAISS